MAGHRKRAGQPPRPTQAEAGAERRQDEIGRRVGTSHTVAGRISATRDYVLSVLKHAGDDPGLARDLDSLAQQMRERCSGHLLRASTPRAQAPRSTPRSTHVPHPGTTRTA